MSGSSPKSLLLEEMTKECINALKVRELCRDNPGLIASAGMRIRIWSLLLLGSAHAVSETTDLQPPEKSCGEQHVLEADVKRTRADIEIFRSTSWRRGITDILQVFCVTHRIQYKQGMNEIVAPFLFVNAPPHGEALSYLLYEAFLFRYVENFFCQDDSVFLFKAFRLFHILLVYLDPQLAKHLDDQQFVPELYAPQWFLTMYSRGLTLPLVLRLWDMMIAVDDPAFTFFVGIALLRQQRDKLLLAESYQIPEILSDMHIKGESSVDELVIIALELYRRTPKCFLRYLRICCVKTPELMPLAQPRILQWKGKDSNTIIPTKRRHANTMSSVDEYYSSEEEEEEGIEGGGDCGAKEDSSMALRQSLRTTKKMLSGRWGNYVEGMARQSVRQCLAITPSEFVSRNLPRDIRERDMTSSASVSPHIDSQEQTDSRKSKSMSPSCSSGFDENRQNGTESLPNKRKNEILKESTQLIVIDVRSLEEVEISGGGMLPTAIQLEPDFVDQPESLEIWLDHFDGMKGCHVCIVDMPPAQASSTALWKRLLLGTGDGVSPNVINYNSFSHGGSGMHSSIQQPRDDKSPFIQAEIIATQDDLVRVSVKLAQVLHSHGFPYVSILDGGFPSLITHLLQSRGTTEPLIINHDNEKWINYLNFSGKGNHLSDDLKPLNNIISMNGKKSQKADSKRKLLEKKSISAIYDIEVALEVAKRLGHERMTHILEGKLNILKDTKR